MASLPRVQRIVAELFRNDPRTEDAEITTWVPDVDYRNFPMINIRRIGGIRNPDGPTIHSLPVIELSVYSGESLIEAEELYESALDVLYDSVKYQTATSEGYIVSIYETMGATQFSSLYQDSWRVQGLIRLGIRNPRT